MRQPVTILAAVVLAVLPATAAAQSPTEPVQEGAREQSCKTLLGGTINAPDTVSPPSAGTLPATWPVAPATVALPQRVLLRTEHESFNRLYEWATRGGQLYAHVRGDTGPWRQMPLPLCFDGRIDSIGADDDELVALDAGRRIYTLDNALKDPATWNWSSRWGTPFWNGLGYALPGAIRAWSWTVISPAEDKTWTDPAGNHPAVGTFKVSHIWGLRSGGQRLTFWDPWLPPDESYEACGPERGRFRAVNLSTSGSHLFLIGAHGDLFTRLYDFDISGHDPLFFGYSYEDQRGRGSAAKIQLPAEPWTRQPKIPGAITSAISIEKQGEGAVHATLRVEGEQAGRTGYWERDLAAPAAAGWTFHETGLPLSRPLLDDPAADTSLLDLGRGEDRRYVMTGGAVTGEITDFDVYCPPAHVRIRDADGTTHAYLLHHLDGIRQQTRGRGLDDTPRTQTGALEGPPGHFQTVTVHATRGEVVVEEKGWHFRYAGDGADAGQPLSAARCLPATLGVGRGGVGPVVLGGTDAALLPGLPPLTGHTTVARRWCVDGGSGAVAAVLARGRVVLVRTTAAGHAVRGLRPGVRVGALPGAFPRARRVAPGVWLLAPGGRTVAQVAGGRVRALATTTRATLRAPKLLRARLRAAG